MPNFNLTPFTSALDEEYEAIKKQIDELNELYIDSKERLDENTGIRTSPVFITNQTDNLINIKGKILDVYKELVNIKKVKIDAAVKEANINKNQVDSNGSSELLNQIFGLLVNSDRKELIESVGASNDDSIMELPEEEIDKLISESLSKEQNEKEKDEEYNKLMKYLDKSGFRIVVDDQKNKYVIDDDYQEIDIGDKFDVDGLIKIVSINFNKDTNTSVATDDRNNNYEVIEIE